MSLTLEVRQPTARASEARAARTAVEPDADLTAYLSADPHVIAELDADVTTCWD